MVKGWFNSQSKPPAWNINSSSTSYRTSVARDVCRQGSQFKAILSRAIQVARSVVGVRLCSGRQARPEHLRRLVSFSADDRQHGCVARPPGVGRSQSSEMGRDGLLELRPLRRGVAVSGRFELPKRPCLSLVVEEDALPAKNHSQQDETRRQSKHDGLKCRHWRPHAFRPRGEVHAFTAEPEVEPDSCRHCDVWQLSDGETSGYARYLCNFRVAAGACANRPGGLAARRPLFPAHFASTATFSTCSSRSARRRSSAATVISRLSRRTAMALAVAG